MTRQLLLLAVAVFVGGPASAGGKVDVKGELKRFEGTWLGVSSESNGTQSPKDVATSLTMTFTGDKFVLRIVGKDRAIEGTMKVDPSKTPKEFEWTAEVLGKKRTTIGIYAFEDDTLKMCSTPEGGQRPKTFSTKDGTDAQPVFLAVYKRENKK
jgi:uncharacterized protein (TIGR03067 family)